MTQPGTELLTAAHAQQSHIYPGLDGLRALMALWVLVGHVGNFMGWHLGAPVPIWIKPFLLTSVPVNIFICLSGFVIFQMLGKLTWAGYLNYIKGRARRILPIYWVAMIAAIALFQFRLELKSMVPWHSAADAANAHLRNIAVASDFPVHVASHLTLIHGAIPETLLPFAAESILAPAWSLSLEWQFYLLAPAIFSLLSRRKLGFLALVLVFGFLTLSLRFSELGLTPAFFLVSWPYFALGWWSSNCLAYQRDRSPSSLVLFFAPIVIAVGAALHQSGDARATALSMALWLVAWVSCCKPGTLAWMSRPVRAILGNSLLVATGKRSYSLYLLHVLILDVTAYVLIRFGWLSESSGLEFLILLIPTFIASLLISWFTYSMIERRFMGKSTVPRASA